MNILLDKEAQQIDIFKAYFAGLRCQEFSDLDAEAFSQIYEERSFTSFLKILERNHFDTPKSSCQLAVRPDIHGGILSRGMTDSVVNARAIIYILLYCNTHT